MFRSLNLEDIQGAVNVKRWHKIKTRRVQTVAEHSYTVTMLAGRLAEYFKDPFTPQEERDLMNITMTHDTHETEYGDFPTPTKKQFDILGIGGVMEMLETMFWHKRGEDKTPGWGASKRVVHLADIADKLEAMLFYSEEGYHMDILEILASDVFKKVQECFPEDEHQDFRAIVMSIVGSRLQHTVCTTRAPEPLG